MSYLRKFLDKLRRVVKISLRIFDVLEQIRTLEPPESKQSVTPVITP
jgi:hypothetical protein